MDLSKLPQLEGWISGEVADPRAFPQANVTVGEAAALSLLFWPAFTEYRDCVFLDFLFDRPGVDRWFDELKATSRQLRASLTMSICGTFLRRSRMPNTWFCRKLHLVLARCGYSN